MNRHVFSAVVWAGLVALGGASAAGQLKSVRPGINDAYQYPNVPEFVGRFERDGREVYNRRKDILAACRIRPGMAVADVGAGTGLFTRLFSEEVGPRGRVYAVDISKEFVEHIQRTCRERGMRNVVGVVCRSDCVDLPPESIDLAFLCSTYHHLEFPSRTMRSIHRALRPGGKVVLVDLIRIEGVSSDWVLGHVRAGQETFVAEITAEGFRLLDERRFLKENYFVRFEKADPRPAKSSDASSNPARQ